MKHLESDIQKTIVQLLCTLHITVFSIPNETLMAALKMLQVPEKRRYAIYNHFEAMGLTPGIPDLCVLGPGKAVFIDVKKPGESPTAGQSDMHDIIRSMNHSVYVVESIEEAIECLQGEGFRI